MALEYIRRITRSRALVELPKRGRDLINRIPEPVQLRMRRISYRSMSLTREILAGLLVIGIIAAGFAYARLNQGPVMLSFLAETLEKSINRELAGLSVKIGDVILKKPENGTGVLFRLVNIRLIDQRGDVVAQAPRAAIGLSGRALLWGRIAPGSVDLIGPRLVLHYNQGSGLAFSFSRPDPEQSVPAPSDRTSNIRITRSEKKAETVVELQHSSTAQQREARSINLVQTVYNAFEQARRRQTTSSYLSRFGFRDALVVFGEGNEQQYWRVPDFSLDLEHRRKRSTIHGTANIEAPKGDWTLRFRTEQSEKRKELTFTALFEDVVPNHLAETFPAIDMLKFLDMPVQGKVSVSLTKVGEIKGAEVNLAFAAGHITVPWEKKQPLLLDEGRLNLRYDQKSGRVHVLPSQFHWGESRATVRGEMWRTSGKGEEAIWDFALDAGDTALSAEAYGVAPVAAKEWSIRGSYHPGQRQVRLDQYRLSMPGGSMVLSGTITNDPNAPGSPEIILNGGLSAMGPETLLRIWPPLIAPLARSWIGEHVAEGVMTGGEVSLAIPAGVLANVRKGGDVPDDAVSIRFGAKNLSVRYLKSLPPTRSAHATITITGRKLISNISSGELVLASGKKVAVKDGRFEIADLRPLHPNGQVSFKTAGSAAATLELLGYKPFEFLKKSDLRPEQFSGKASSEFSLLMPLKSDMTMRELQVSGKARLDGLRASNLHGNVSITGGSLAFGVTEKAVDARGDILLNGVPAKFQWQRIFGGKVERQPAIRISGVFDDSARKQIGLSVGQFLKGDVPAEISITRGADNKPSFHLEADLSGAEFSLPQMAWKKLRGRNAVVAFDIAKSEPDVTELRNFKIVGDGIAIDGWLSFGKGNNLRSFYFPDFSVDVITQMEVAGKRGDDDIWQVNAKSSSFDGRRFFRSLFSIEKNSAQSPGLGSRKGVNFEAEFANMVGYFNTSLKSLSISMQKRDGRLTVFTATGKLNGEAPVSVAVDHQPGKQRILVGETSDAGSAFRLIGFYPKIEGGQGRLSVNLDGEGDASATGNVKVQNFKIIGDPVSQSDGMEADEYVARRKKGPTIYQKFDFEWMEIPFSVGHGQFVLKDARINGPLLGATMRGWVDFEKEQILVGGTYTPAYGLTAIPGEIPIFGQLLVGRRGEGILGVTYAIQGPIASPEVLVNPVSMMFPGVFRQILEMSPSSPKVLPRNKSTRAPRAPPGRSQDPDYPED